MTGTARTVSGWVSGSPAGPQVIPPSQVNYPQLSIRFGNQPTTSKKKHPQQGRKAFHFASFHIQIPNSAEINSICPLGDVFRLHFSIIFEKNHMDTPWCVFVKGAGELGADTHLG